MQQENSSSEQRDVLDVISRMTSSFHRKDLPGILSAYEPDAVIIFEPKTPVSGIEAIREGFTSFFGVDPRFEYAAHEVFIKGDLAIHFAPWTMTGHDADGGPFSQTGLSVAVLRKQPDGRWLMAIDNPYGNLLLDKAQ